jgi:hypothetical protein
VARIQSMDVGDLDGDGRPEIVTSGLFGDETNGSYEGEIRVWSYDAESNTSVVRDSQFWFHAGPTLSSTRIADVDNDGMNEVVVAGHSPEPVVYSRMSIWNFTSGQLHMETETDWFGLSCTLAKSVSLDDIDGDGEPEITIAGYSQTTQYLKGCVEVWNYTHNGATLVKERVMVWTDDDRTRFFTVNTGDIDGDGEIEIVSTGSGWDEINFTQTSEIVVFNLTEPRHLSVEYLVSWHGFGGDISLLYELDGDNLPELIVADTRQIGNYGWEYITIWKYSAGEGDLVLYGSGNWRGSVSLAYISLASDCFQCDQYIFTAGHTDVGPDRFGLLQIWKFDLNNKTAYVVEDNTWGLGPYSSTSVHSVALADIDSDGVLELLTGGTKTKTYQIRIWKP